MATRWCCGKRNNKGPAMDLNQKSDKTVMLRYMFRKLGQLSALIRLHNSKIMKCRFAEDA